MSLVSNPNVYSTASASASASSDIMIALEKYTKRFTHSCHEKREKKVRNKI